MAGNPDARRHKMRLALYALFLLAVCLPVSAVDAGQYLPLSSVKRWDLLSKPGSVRMSFVNEGSSRPNTYRIRWENPWVHASFLFKLDADKVLLESLDMGNGVAPMPAQTVYFDFGAGSGKSWSNVIGKLKVVSNDATIKAPAGTFNHCVEIESVDKGGSKSYWFFAPSVGFVQFGEGSGAFLLTSYTGGSTASDRSAIVPPAIKASGDAGKLFLGLESNPSPAQGYSFEAKQSSFEMSNAAGSDLIFVSPVWRDFERKPGKYEFSDIDERVRIAQKFGAAVLLNLRIIDTNNKAVPSEYSHWSWDDPRMQAKISAALEAIAHHLNGTCRWVEVGNEVNEYFAQHKDEIAPYARLVSALKPSVKSLFSGLPFTVNFTYSGVAEFNERYSSILSVVDLYSVNYYPINADFTFRDPSLAGRELQSILDQLNGKPVIIQEMGYASSHTVGSSEQKQADFVKAVLAVIAQNRNKVVAANFNWRSDLPDSVVRDLTQYYKLGSSDRFAAFLGSLGWFHKDGSPKQAWYTFQKEAPPLMRQQP